MHTYLSCHNQTYANSQYSIFVAEVASTVNEMLLRLYLLDHSNDDNEKKHILNEMLELFKSTIYRQTMFAEFERDMHAAKENGVIMSREYEPNSLVLNNDEMFELTEWIPTIEEVKENLGKVKTL